MIGNMKKNILSAAIISALTVYSSLGQAADPVPGELSQAPLFVDVTDENINTDGLTPNVIMLFDNSGSMAYCYYNNRSCSGNKPNQRLSHLKTAANELADMLVDYQAFDLPKVNLGLARFFQGAPEILLPILPIDEPIKGRYSERFRRGGNDNAYDFDDAFKFRVNNMSADGGTPLSQSLSSMGRYFSKGQSDILIHNSQKTSANRFYTYKPDTDFNIEIYAPYFSYPIADVEITEDWAKNYKSLSEVNMPAVSGGINKCTQAEPPNLNHIILLTDGDHDTGDVLGPRELSNYTGNRNSEKSKIIDVVKALYETDFRPDVSGKQNVVTHIVGFGSGVGSPDILQRAVSGMGEFKSASKSDELVEAFKDIFKSIQIPPEKDIKTVPITFNGSILEDDSRAYSSAFSTNPWKGDIKAYRVNVDGSIDVSEGSELWSAATLLGSRSRNLLTSNNGRGVIFKENNFAALSQLQKDDLKNASSGTGSDNDKIQEGIKFVSNLSLGDIVNSEARFVSVVDGNNQPLKGQGTIYVGSNDGMMHAFDASNGEEYFAYIPEGVFSTDENRGFSFLRNKKINGHRFMVDKTPTINDTLYNKTYLFGSLGAGGKSVYGLDVTDPTSMNASKVLWEFKDPGLGYSFSRARMVQTAKNSQKVLFGSGYPEKITDDLPAKVFVLDPKTGSSRSVTTSRDSKGMSSLELVDTVGDRILDRVYAGDLIGNLWSIDIESGVMRILFAAGENKRITTKPIVLMHSDGGVMVMFGTGSYHYNGDDVDLNTQSFYGIYDKSNGGSDTKTIRQSDLLEVTITQQSRDGNDYRTTSTGKSVSGWYFDLPDVSSGSERVIVDPVLIGRTVFITTAVPFNEGECKRGSYGWLMAVNAYDGGPTDPETSLYDLDRNGVIDDGDTFNGEIPVGIKLNGDANGAPPSKVTFQTDDNGKIKIYLGDDNGKKTSGAGGAGNLTIEPEDVSLPHMAGRKTWREIKN